MLTSQQSCSEQAWHGMEGSHGLVCASSQQVALAPAVNEAAAGWARCGAKEAPAPTPAGDCGGLSPSASALWLEEFARGGLGRSSLAVEGVVAARVVP